MQLISRQEAQGLLHYYTGKPCLRGHVSQRRVSNNVCVACTQTAEYKAQVAAWAKRNPEKRAVIDARYAKNHPEKTSAVKIAWAKANPEAAGAINAAWRKRNPDQARAAIAAWNTANPAARAAMHAQRRAAKLQRTPKWLTTADRQAIKAIYEQANFMSRVCGEPMHVDHVYPLQGKKVSGLHCPANLQILTATENVKKSNKLLDNPFLQ